MQRNTEKVSSAGAEVSGNFFTMKVPPHFHVQWCVRPPGACRFTIEVLPPSGGVYSGMPSAPAALSCAVLCSPAGRMQVCCIKVCAS